MSILTETEFLRHQIKEYAVAYMAIKNPMYEILDRRHRDKIFQGLNNNLFGNNPGEIDRWCDDGGR